MTFAEKLLNLRRARNWTQEELADKIGVTRQALSKWEANTALPDTKNVVAIARLFGVTTDYLLCEDEGREMEAGQHGRAEKPGFAQGQHSRRSGRCAARPRLLRRAGNIYFKYFCRYYYGAGQRIFRISSRP